MTEIKVPILDPVSGKVPARYLDLSGIAPGTGTGAGPQVTAFGFAGDLVIRTGVQLWLTPYWGAIRLKALTAQLGQLPTTGDTTFRLMVNGTPYATVTITTSNRTASVTTFTGGTIAASSLLSIDITVAPTSATKAADAVIQTWWEYV